MKKTRRSTARHSTTDALEILDHALADAIVGQLIYDARVKAKLTQKQLADLIDTDQAVISRLEDADYEGHSLTMLRRIAHALGKRLDIRFVDAA